MVRHEIPGAAFTSLSLTGPQKPGCELLLLHICLPLSPTWSAGSFLLAPPATTHLTFNLTGFTSPPAKEIIQTSQSDYFENNKGCYYKDCLPQLLLVYSVSKCNLCAPCMKDNVLFPQAMSTYG